MCVCCAAAFGALEAAQQLHVRANYSGMHRGLGALLLLLLSSHQVGEYCSSTSSYTKYMQADQIFCCRHGLLGARVLACQQAP